MASIRTLVLLGIVLATPAASAAATCESLAMLTLANTRVDAAQVVGAGAFTPPGGAGRGGRGGANPFKELPAFCRVALTLAPTSDSDIKVEVWLPVAGWNGKYQAVGNGGWAGTISFMAPGMGHCGGGEGPNSFDMVGALEQWVEQGAAPSRIVASRLADGKAVRTRPLCPHPQVAVYNGSGSTDDAANFTCGPLQK